LAVTKYFFGDTLYIERDEKMKIKQKFGVRIPDDPSAMIGLKILSVETFCFGV